MNCPESFIGYNIPCNECYHYPECMATAYEKQVELTEKLDNPAKYSHYLSNKQTNTSVVL